MKVVSDGCICATCLEKHACEECAMLIAIQRLADKYLAYGNKNIQVVFQIEKCPFQKKRVDKK